MTILHDEARDSAAVAVAPSGENTDSSLGVGEAPNSPGGDSSESPSGPFFQSDRKPYPNMPGLGPYRLCLTPREWKGVIEGVTL